MRKKNILKKVTILGLGVFTGYCIGNYISGKKYLKEHTDLNFDKLFIKEFENANKINLIEKRIEYIENKIASEKNIDKIFGAFLLFITLERVLFQLCCIHCKNKEKKPGIINYLKKLRSQNDSYMERKDYEGLKKYTEEIRNPIFHGEMKKENFQKLEESFEFIKTYLIKTGIKSL